MLDIIFVFFIFLLAVIATKTTINPVVYHAVRWGVYLLTAITTLLILNHESVGQLFVQISNTLIQLGIGYPRSWELKTRHFDTVIAGCYYLTFFSTSLILVLSATYEHKGMSIARARDSLINWAGIAIFSWILYEVFWSSSSFSSGYFNRLLRLFYNSQIGLIIHQYIVINVMAKLVGLAIRAIFTKSNLETLKGDKDV